MEKSVAGNQIRRMTCENNQAHRDVINSSTYDQL
jgi:hypothetical protein